MSPKILTLDLLLPNPSMIGMERGSTPDKSGKEINFTGKESRSFRIAWKWDPTSNYLFYHIVSFHPKTTNLWRSLRRYIWPNKPLMTPKPTTSARSLVLKGERKRSYKKEAVAELQSAVEVPIKNKKIFLRTFNLFISSLLQIMMNSWTKVSKRFKSYLMESKIKKLRQCWKVWILNWWVSSMITFVTIVSKKDTEHGHAPLEQKIKCKLFVQYADKLLIQLQIVHRSKLISRRSKQIKLLCCSNRNMTSSDRNLHKSRKEDWHSSQTLTERSFWQSDKIHQVAPNKDNLHIPTNKRQRNLLNKAWPTTVCRSSKMIDQFLFVYCLKKVFYLIFNYEFWFKFVIWPNK